MTSFRQFLLPALLAAAFLLSPAAARAGAYTRGVWNPNAQPDAAILFLQWAARDSRGGSPDRLVGQLAGATPRELELVLREPDAKAVAGGKPLVVRVTAPVSFCGLGRATTCARCGATAQHADDPLGSRAYQPGKGCLFDVTFRLPAKCSRLEVVDVLADGVAVPYLAPFEGAPRVVRGPSKLVPPANAVLHAARLRHEGGEPGFVRSPAEFDPAGTEKFTLGSGKLVFAMRRIPAGSCVREGRDNLVNSNAFYMCETEFTQEQWKELTGVKPPNPQEPESASCPLQGATADDAQLVCAALEVLHPVRGYEWKLPTRAQFEFAARAGETDVKPAADLDSIAWHAGNSALRARGDAAPKKAAHPVGTKAPNAFGLFDTIGNVSELCRSGGRREEVSALGGGYWSKEKDCHFPRSEGVGFFGSTAAHAGFRLVLAPPDPPLPAKKGAKKPQWKTVPPPVAPPPAAPAAPEASASPAEAEEEADPASGALAHLQKRLHFDPPRKVKIFRESNAATASKFSSLSDLVLFAPAGRTRGRVGFVTAAGKRETGYVDLEEIGLFERGRGLVGDERGGPWGLFVAFKPTELWRMGADGRPHVVATVPKGTAIRLYGFANDAGTIVRVAVPPREGAAPATALMRFRDLQ